LADTWGAGPEFLTGSLLDAVQIASTTKRHIPLIFKCYMIPSG
jgi:hypothetical protein